MTEQRQITVYGKWVVAVCLSFVLFSASCGKKEPEAEPVEKSEPGVSKPEQKYDVVRELVEYKDPKGAFVVLWPKDYVYFDKTVGDKIKFIFAYGPPLNVMINVFAAEPGWDSETQLAVKKEEIKTGRAGFPPPMALDESGLVSFGGLTGFHVLLSGTLEGQKTEIKNYFVTGEGKLLSIIVTCKDPRAKVLYGQLLATITNSLHLVSYKPDEKAPATVTKTLTNVQPEKAKPAPVVKSVTVPVTNIVSTSPPEKAITSEVEVPVAPVVPVDPRTDSEWASAKATLKFAGTMKMGGQEVAMVNNKILRNGDSVSVDFHGKTFNFIVQSMSPTGVEYKRELATPSP